MPGPANALNISESGIVVFDGVSNFNGVPAGTSGDVLTSNGAGMLPSFQPASGGSTSGFIAYAATPTVLLTNTYVKIGFDTPLLDTDAAYDTVTSTYTVPVGGAGSYQASFGFSINDLDATTTAMLVVFNTSDYGRIALKEISPFPITIGTSPTLYTDTVSTNMLLTAGSTVTCEIYLNTTAGAPTTKVNYTSGTIFSMFKI